MVTLEFCGAAKTVTGSNYLVKTDKTTFIVDCGMFQGPKVEQYNLEDLIYDPSQVDFVLLTHAHIDHSGMLPKLYKHGFTTQPPLKFNNNVGIILFALINTVKFFFLLIILSIIKLLFFLYSNELNEYA
jgi:Cft2 family RNA processing exonuclease